MHEDTTMRSISTTQQQLTPYTETVEALTVDGQTYWQGCVTWREQPQHTTACYPSDWEARQAALDWMEAQWTEEAAQQETFGNPSAWYWR
jgi:hypothetical protein